MILLLNGVSHSVAQAKTVAQLVTELQLLPTTLLIEHNGVALHRNEWNACALRDGDRIELVRVVAGG
jgi:thiamine biosynthesis protein ThiS